MQVSIKIFMGIPITPHYTEISPFFFRLYHVKEEDIKILDKEIKRLYYFGIFKESFLTYSCPVMLISRKVTKDKRIVTDFSNLNITIGKIT